MSPQSSARYKYLDAIDELEYDKFARRHFEKANMKLAEGVNKYLKGKSKKEKKHAYDTIKSMIEIIWNNIRKNVRKALDLKKGKKAKKDEQ